MPLWPELSLVAGEAVAAALRAETGVDATLRHPNDVVVAGRKLVGVLPEASPGRVVLGIGVNVNQSAPELPAETAKPPTSLRVELGREVERAPLLAAILVRARARLRRLADGEKVALCPSPRVVHKPRRDRFQDVARRLLVLALSAAISAIGAPQALGARSCSPSASASTRRQPGYARLHLGPVLAGEERTVTGQP